MRAYYKIYLQGRNRTKKNHRILDQISSKDDRGYDSVADDDDNESSDVDNVDEKSMLIGRREMSRMPSILVRELWKNCIKLNWQSYEKCKIRHIVLRDLAFIACYNRQEIIFITVLLHSC